MSKRVPMEWHPPKDWHKEDVKAAVRKTRYGSLKALSLAFGLAHYACDKACREPNYWGEMAIAEALGLSPREIWPSRYLNDKPRLVRSVPDNTKLKSAPHRRIARAA